MNSTEFFIRRRITTTLLMAAISLFGLLAYFGLPVSDLPAIDFPTITVSASQPGASPETMANTVATPLEREFTSLQGISSINSTSSVGSDADHAAVRSFAQHRRRRAGCAGRYLGRKPRSAAEHAAAADVPQSESGGIADHLSRCQFDRPAAVRGG